MAILRIDQSGISMPIQQKYFELRDIHALQGRNGYRCARTPK